MEVKTCTLKTVRRLIKEIEEDTNKWKDIPCSHIRITNIFKMPILPKAFRDLMQS